jgi:hypothetical protein
VEAIFVELHLMGTDQQPLLVNVAAISSVEPRFSRSNVKEIEGTWVWMNHAAGGGEDMNTVGYAVREKYETIVAQIGHFADVIRVKAE